MDNAGDNLEGLLGPLEAEIMEITWRDAPVTPGAVREALGAKRPLAYTTVMTVMSRLYEKGLLDRIREGRAFAYSPRVSKVELLGRRASSALAALSRAGARPTLSYFVDAASSLDDDQLATLEREIARLREKRS